MACNTGDSAGSVTSTPSTTTAPTGPAIRPCHPSAVGIEMCDIVDSLAPPFHRSHALISPCHELSLSLSLIVIADTTSIIVSALEIYEIRLCLYFSRSGVMCFCLYICFLYLLIRQAKGFLPPTTSGAKKIKKNKK